MGAAEGIGVLAFVCYVQCAETGAGRADAENLVGINRRLHPCTRDEDAFDRCGEVDVQLLRDGDRVKLAELLLIPRLVLARIIAPVEPKHPLGGPFRHLAMEGIADAVGGADVDAAVRGLR